jgi:hypothetical protein
MNVVSIARVKKEGKDVSFATLSFDFQMPCSRRCHSDVSEHLPKLEHVTARRECGQKDETIHLFVAKNIKASVINGSLDIRSSFSLFEAQQTICSKECRRVFRDDEEPRGECFGRWCVQLRNCFNASAGHMIGSSLCRLIEYQTILPVPSNLHLHSSNT